MVPCSLLPSGGPSHVMTSLLSEVDGGLVSVLTANIRDDLDGGLFLAVLSLDIRGSLVSSGCLV